MSDLKFPDSGDLRQAGPSERRTPKDPIESSRNAALDRANRRRSYSMVTIYNKAQEATDIHKQFTQHANDSERNIGFRQQGYEPPVMAGPPPSQNHHYVTVISLASGNFRAEKRSRFLTPDENPHEKDKLSAIPLLFPGRAVPVTLPRFKRILEFQFRPLNDSTLHEHISK